jgi:hypothetical protein
MLKDYPELVRPTPAVDTQPADQQPVVAPAPLTTAAVVPTAEVQHP